MQKNMTDRTPGSYDDFVAYLGTVRTEEELFSPLTYWFVGQNCPEDVCFRRWRRSSPLPLVGEPLAKPFTLRGLPKPPLLGEVASRQR